MNSPYTNWKVEPFEKLFSDETGGNTKIKQSEYLNDGPLPIVDQGQKLIAGYASSLECQCKVSLPCILFGDHTKIFKYIDFPFALGADGVKVLEPTKDVLAKYAYYYLKQVKLQGKEGYIRNFKYLKRILIPLPPYQLQNKIASILEKVDAAREKRRQASRLTEEFLRSAFLEMFGDPVSNPKRWDTSTIGDILERIDSGKSPVCLDRKAEDGEWGVLKLSSVTSSKFNWRENKALPGHFLPNENIEVHKGDLLLVRKNTYELVGRCAYVNETRSRLMLSDLIFRLVIKREVVDPAYLWCLINHPATQRQIRNLAGGSAGSMPNISKERLKKIIIPMPPKKKQRVFANIVERVEALRAKQRESEKQLDDLFHSLMQRAFRGELVFQSN